VIRGSIAAGILFALAFAGTSGAQITADPGTRTKHFNCGGFTVTAGHTVLVHAALDDVPQGRPAWATLQLYDAVGDVRAEKKDVILQAGDSTTLAMSVSIPGAHVFRAHVEFKEADLPVSARRAGTALVEVLDLTGEVRTVCILIADGGLRPPPQ
jgi:hypothetical protein